MATHRTKDLDQEPTAADLAAIEREWPLIEAELELTDVEVRIWLAQGNVNELDWHRLRRAERRVMREALAFLSVELERRPRRAA